VALLNTANTFLNTNLFKTTSATAFQVQSTGGNNALTVDTSNNQIILGAASNATGTIVFQGSGGAGTLSLSGPTTPNTGNYTLSIPAITANANICTDNSICAGYASATSVSGKLNKNAIDTSSAAVTNPKASYTLSLTLARRWIAVCLNWTTAATPVLPYR
jgi:hypothetical protein